MQHICIRIYAERAPEVSGDVIGTGFSECIQIPTPNTNHQTAFYTICIVFKYEIPRNNQFWAARFFYSAAVKT